MKKQLLVMVAVLLAIILCACSASVNTEHIVHRNGVTYEVDTTSRTISDGTFRYYYIFSEGSNSYSITITYPNGSSYSLSQSGFHGTVGQSNDYSSALYTDGEILCDILEDILLSEQESGLKITGGKIIAALFLVAAGIFLFVFPRAAWYLSRGWYYKNAEPSDAALIWTRISGVIYVLFAIIIIFLPI